MSCQLQKNHPQLVITHNVWLGCFFKGRNYFEDTLHSVQTRGRLRYQVINDPFLMTEIISFLFVCFKQKVIITKIMYI